MSAANEYYSGVTTYSSPEATRNITNLLCHYLPNSIKLCYRSLFLYAESLRNAPVLDGYDAPKAQHSDVSTVITPFETLRPRYLEVHCLYVEAPFSLNLP
ncbi:hypothetical protein BCV72DRAFT_224959, partial [Rhizopus microsporus var. microsporus]